jgi:quercetin dioxygenase-like cupin family protein
VPEQSLSVKGGPVVGMKLYLVARGTAVLRVGEESVTLRPGDVLVVEPGEAHTFLTSSPDFFHFVVQSPGLQGDEARADKTPVGRSTLGL